MVVSTGSTTVLFLSTTTGFSVVELVETTLFFINHRGFFRWLSLSKPRYFYQPPRSFRWLSSSKPRPFYQTLLIFRWLSLSKPHSFYQPPQVFRWLSLSKPPFLSTTEGVTALPCAKRIQGCLWRQGSGVLVEVLELRSFLQQSLLRNRHRQKAEKLSDSSLKEFP